LSSRLFSWFSIPAPLTFCGGGWADDTVALYLIIGS
jgi:hypothetical protein